MKTYIIDTRARRGLDLSTLNRRRAGSAKRAQVGAWLFAAALAIVAGMTLAG